jgi:hypothetical protein
MELTSMVTEYVDNQNSRLNFVKDYMFKEMDVPGSVIGKLGK